MKSVRDLPSESSQARKERKKKWGKSGSNESVFFTVKAPDEPKLLEKIK